MVAIGIGFLAWRSHRWSGVGHLIVVVGATNYLQNLQVSSNAVLSGLGFCVAYLWAAVIAHLVLTWPSGRVTGRGLRLLVLGCYTAAVGSQVLRFVVDRPVRAENPSKLLARAFISCFGRL